MSQSTIKPVFKAKDNSEHPTAAAAERQNKVVKAQREFKDAVENVQRYLKEGAMTADGVPFTEAGCDFWHVAKWAGRGLPFVHKIYIFPYHVSLDDDHRDGGLVVYFYDGNRKEQIRYRIDELYADEQKAIAACVDECEERMADYRKQIDALKAKSP